MGTPLRVAVRKCMMRHPGESVTLSDAEIRALLEDQKQGGAEEALAQVTTAKVRAQADEIARLKAEVAQLRRWGKERNDELCADLAAHKRALGAGVVVVAGPLDALADNAALRAACRNDTPYPVPDLLERFAEVADALLHRHDYDGHGWELVQSAMEHARDAAPRLRAALASPHPGAGCVVLTREEAAQVMTIVKRHPCGNRHPDRDFHGPCAGCDAESVLRAVLDAKA